MVEQEDEHLNLYQEKKPKLMKSFRYKYIGSLSILAIILSVDLMLMQQQMQQLSNDSHIINMSGRQRMLTERISRSALELMTVKNPDDVSTAQQVIADSVNAMNDSHEILISQKYLSSTKIVSHIYDQETGFDSIMKKYHVAATNLIGISVSELSLANNSYQTINSLRPMLLEAANKLVGLYELQSKKKVQQLRKAGLVLRVLEIFTLIAICIFIFRPMDKRLNADRRTLQHQVDEQTRAAKEREQFLTDVLNNVYDGILTLDENGKIINFNYAAEQISGYQADEVLGQSFIMLLTERFALEFQEYLERYLQTGQAKILGTSRRIDAKHKNGHVFPIDLEINEIVNDNSMMFVGSFRDVSEKVKRVKELDKTNAFLDSVIDNLPVAVFVKDAVDLNFVRVNKSFSELVGVPKEKLIGKSDRDFFPQEQANFFNQRDYEVIEQGRIMHIPEEELETAHKGLRILKTIKVPVKNEDGDAQYLLGITEDITEQKLTKQELLEAKDAAEKASTAKSQFLANMSHELRTPLNAIIGYSEMLAEDAEEFNQPQSLDDLNKIKDSGKHLLELINDVLDLSKVESGKIELELYEFPIAELIEDVTAMVKPLVEKQGNTLQLNISGHPGNLINDPLKLKQVLFNLLSNASKFTENGQITLSVSNVETDDGNQMIEFRVDDSGIGMSPDVRARLFEPFVQADVSVTRKYGGTGLGLAITKSFVELMGGEINVESVPGKGSVFSVVIPVEIKTTKHADNIEVKTKTAEIVKELSSNTVGKGTILIIDDEANARELLSHYLANVGWQIITADNGEEGIKLARQYKPDAITLDVLMDGVDGWGVLEVLKAEPELAQIPVVMCTIVDEKQRGFSLGATEYLMKPIKRSEFIATLDRFSNGHIKHLLVVEDDPATRELVARTARKRGWEVTEAANGEEALEKLDTEDQPDLVFLDLMMPKVDGFDVVKAMQDNGDWKEIPIVIMTAKDLTDFDRQRLNGNVEFILEKQGYNKESLLAEISSQLEKVTRIQS